MSKKLIRTFKQFLLFFFLANSLTQIFCATQTIGGAWIQAPSYASVFFSFVKKQKNKREKNNYTEIIQQRGVCSRQFFTPTFFENTADMQLSATPTDQQKPKLFAGFLLSALAYCLKNNAASAHRPSSPEPATPASTSSENSNVSQVSTSSDEPSVAVRSQQEPLEHKNEHDNEIAPPEKYLFQDCFTPEAKQERASYATEFFYDQQKPTLVKSIIIRPDKDKRILLACVHGTRSNPDSFGGNTNKPLTKKIIRFGRFLAQNYDSGVEIIPFGWSGELSHQDRVTAGIALEKYINLIIKTNQDIIYTHLWSIAHSHGCNVTSLMAQRIKFSHPLLPITGVYMASPIAPEETNKAICMDACYHFYGAHDTTQLAGSLQAGGGSERKIYSLNTTNICMLKDNENTSHKSIKEPTIRNLPKMLYSIQRWYKPYIDLMASTTHVKHYENQNKEQVNPANLPLVCIKHINTDEFDSEQAKKVSLARKEKYTDLEAESQKRHAEQASFFKSMLDKDPNAPTPMHQRFISSAKHVIFDVLDATKIYKSS